MSRKIKVVKPSCRITTDGPDGNVYVIIGRAEAALKSMGLQEQAKELVEKVMHASSYQEVLDMLLKYVNVIWY